MRGEVRVGMRDGVWGGGGTSGMHGKGPTKGGQGTRGAHQEHVAHGCDLGRVEAQRLVEGHRVLPSRKEGVRCGARCSEARSVGAEQQRSASGMLGEGQTQGGGQRARVERTWNMRYMVVTLDVSKLSGWLKAAAFYRVEREACTRDAGRSVRAGRLDIGRGAGASGMCTGRARLKAGGQGMRGAHVEHAAHVRHEDKEGHGADWQGLKQPYQEGLTPSMKAIRAVTMLCGWTMDSCMDFLRPRRARENGGFAPFE